MKSAQIDEELGAAKARLEDLQRALDRGVHRNELLVAAQQTVDELTCLLDEAPDYERLINRLLGSYEKLVAKLLN